MTKTNLTARLGQLLIDAVEQCIAPNAVSDLAYEMLYDANIDEHRAAKLSEMMFELSSWVNPPVDYLKNAADCLEHLVAIANSDADHDISIKIDDKEYQLYDLAALVSSLADAMEYFISEIK